MAKCVLITGGAGFIGSHVADDLLRTGWRVRVLDSLLPQVHGADGERPSYLQPDIELIRGDVRDATRVAEALTGVDAVVHFAAQVGVGQSMYQIDDYVGANDLGTAVLLQLLIRDPVEKLVVASSMSVYGEGLYRDQDGRDVEQVERAPDAVKRGQFDPRDAAGRALTPVPTPESKRPSLASIYALGKYAQERMCLMVGQAYAMPTVALRFFNVYGTRQALSNPYTGVLAIFASRLLNGNKPVIFEDGEQRRDFVHVTDVARSVRLALAEDEAAGRVFNIGSGRSVSVNDVARQLAATMGRNEFAPEITGKARIGDVRHCFADIGLARQVLGFSPRVEFAAGLEELVEWLAGQRAEDRVDTMRSELEARGLVA
ncbi:MAG: galE [Rhodospirillales bacterium]|nr:galE [Rhodospirillales bacterium]